jgi:hypothetical protein
MLRSTNFTSICSLVWLVTIILCMYACVGVGVADSLTGSLFKANEVEL